MRLGFKLLWNLKPFTICSTSHCAIHTKHPPFHVTLSLFLSPHSLSFLPLHLMLLLFNILAASVSLVKWPQRLFLIWRSWCTWCSCQWCISSTLPFRMLNWVVLQGGLKKKTYMKPWRAGNFNTVISLL